MTNEERYAAALKKSIQHIEQLGAMVNNYSQQLGLGNKVHVQDYTEHAHAALKASGAGKPTGPRTTKRDVPKLSSGSGVDDEPRDDHGRWTK